jgi:hypothetical protein
MTKPSILMFFMVAAVLSFPSCATVSERPVSAGEIKLLRINIPEADSIRANAPFTAYIEFESQDKHDVKEVCFTWSGDGPYCFRITEVYSGFPATFKVQPRIAYPGKYVVDAFVFYVKDGKRTKTNVVSTRIQVHSK